jgi:hypothetical protein
MSARKLDVGGDTRRWQRKSAATRDVSSESRRRYATSAAAKHDDSQHGDGKEIMYSN